MASQKIKEINQAFDQLARVNDINVAYNEIMQRHTTTEQTTPTSRSLDLLRSFQAQEQHRSAALTVTDQAIDKASRTVKLTFASEYPVFRRDLNAYEVLQMSPSASNLNRLNSGGPLLWNHNRDDQIGGIVKSWIGADKRAHAAVKFSRSPRGEEFFQDVIDGILRNVSFNYRILTGKAVAGGKGKPDTFTATSWEALEISLVSVPADPTVGVGRSGAKR